MDEPPPSGPRWIKPVGHRPPIGVADTRGGRSPSQTDDAADAAHAFHCSKVAASRPYDLASRPRAIGLFSRIGRAHAACHFLSSLVQFSDSRRTFAAFADSILVRFGAIFVWYSFGLSKSGDKTTCHAIGAEPVARVARSGSSSSCAGGSRTTSTRSCVVSTNRANGRLKSPS